MNSLLLKEFLRTLKNNLSRFISIVAIIALGVGFFAGISAAENDMVLSATKYYDTHQLMDLRSMNPLGYNTQEINRVKQIDSIEILEEVYRTDLFITANDQRIVTRLFSLDIEAPENQTLNALYLIEGRLPQNAQEIVISDELLNGFDFNIGSTVEFVTPEDQKLQDVLKHNKYTIVGKFHSPLYISYDKEQTNIGSGKVQLIAYIPKQDFALEKISELFIQVQGTQGLSPLSTEYVERVESVQNEINTIGQDFMTKETAELRRTLEKNKQELQENRDLANKELVDAQEQLTQAEIDINEGELTLLREEKEARQKISDGRNEVSSGRTELLNGRLQFNEEYLKYNTAYNEYQTAKMTLDSSKAQLDSARLQLDYSKQMLDQSKVTLDSAKKQLDTMKEAIDAVDLILQNMPAEPDMTLEQYQQIIEAIRVFSEETANYIETYLPYGTPGMMATIQNLLNQLKATYETSKAQYDDGLKQYNDGLKQYEDGEKQYADGMRQYQEGAAQLEAGKQQLDDGKRQLDLAQKQLDDSEAQLNQAVFELDEGERELNEKVAQGLLDLENAKIEFEEAKTIFEKEREDILRKLEEADDELLKAERQIADIPDKWFVYNRDNNPEYSSWFENAEKIGRVALVFPVFFFLVAALVTLTNITRMVEEERTQMGTLKALGYENNALAGKYLLYALSAAVLGTSLGLAVGFIFFPSVLINAYRMMYNMPYMVLEFNWFYAGLSVIFALLSTVGAALAAIFTEIYGKRPAQLMQPKAPTAGKRILLERITPLWRRISFSYKVTFRNLFLYKKRFWMTVIGIAGCTALVLTGFGIKNSVDAVGNHQFKDLFVYDGLVVFDDKLAPEERNIDDILGQEDGIANYKPVLMLSLKVHEADSDRFHEATLMVPQSSTGLENYIVLRDRVSQEPLYLEDDGVIINEKLAEILKISIGDQIHYDDVDNHPYTATVVGITENYLNNYIYMTPTYYQQQHLMKPDYSNSWYNLTTSGKAKDMDIRESILENDAALTIVATNDVATTFENQLVSLSLVVIVLVASAGALAFIVLYNLSKVNITERQRELATIKVLGFRDNEVTAYVYRENLWLTLIGALLGLGVGFYLHRFIMVTVEVSNLMFGKHIHWLSYVLAIFITFIFSAIVNVIMHFELKRINMVEALKSVE